MVASQPIPSIVMILPPASFEPPITATIALPEKEQVLSTEKLIFSAN
jgi:hypothetical protein